MRTSELRASLGIDLESAQGDYADREISSGYASDLLSDVMANAKADGVVTNQERARISHAQDVQSRHIYRQKHDAQHQ